MRHPVRPSLPCRRLRMRSFTRGFRMATGRHTPTRRFAGGVAFKLAWGVGQAVNGADKVGDDFREFLVDATALAALGTIADVVPLVGENRVLAYAGLGGLKQTKLFGRPSPHRIGRPHRPKSRQLSRRLPARPAAECGGADGARAGGRRDADDRIASRGAGDRPTISKRRTASGRRPRKQILEAAIAQAMETGLRPRRLSRHRARGRSVASRRDRHRRQPNRRAIRPADDHGRPPTTATARAAGEASAASTSPRP